MFICRSSLICATNQTSFALQSLNFPHNKINHLRSIQNMLLIITITCLLALLSRNVNGQEIPEDVELVSNADGSSGNLAMPFNNPLYQPYPVGLLPQQQIVRPNRLMTFLRQVKRQMHTKLLQTHFNIVQQRPAYRASARLISDNADAGPMGTIIFTQHPLGEPLMVTINATGLPAGKHALHIHAFGDLREGCKSTGPHVRNILVSKIFILYCPKLFSKIFLKDLFLQKS